MAKKAEAPDVDPAVGAQVEVPEAADVATAVAAVTAAEAMVAADHHYKPTEQLDRWMASQGIRAFLKIPPRRWMLPVRGNTCISPKNDRMAGCLL